MTEIECEYCQKRWEVDEGDVNDEDGDLDGFVCPDCGQVSYVPRI